MLSKNLSSKMNYYLLLMDSRRRMGKHIRKCYILKLLELDSLAQNLKSVYWFQNDLVLSVPRVRVPLLTPVNLLPFHHHICSCRWRSRINLRVHQKMCSNTLSAVSVELIPARTHFNILLVHSFKLPVLVFDDRCTALYLVNHCMELRIMPAANKNSQQMHRALIASVANF